MENSVFVSYSHDDESHKDWVLQLATRLRANGVNALLDRWNLKLGHDLASFMEKGLSASNRVLCICSENYVAKADSGKGGVGYEKQIITAELLNDLSGNWVIPIIKNNTTIKKVPTFLAGRLYTSFENEILYESKYEELLRELLDEPILPIPKLGTNPFKSTEYLASQKFIPGNEKYVSPAKSGTVTFDYSNNNGHYFIGQEELMFELSFTKASDTSIHIYNDPSSIQSIALVKDKADIHEIDDARIYDTSSRARSPRLNQIVVLKNKNGFYAAIKIKNIKDDTRGAEQDEIAFDYFIQTNGTPNLKS